MSADPQFDRFLARLHAIMRDLPDDGAKAEAVGEALRALAASGWRIPDARYRQMQPDAPYGSYLLHLDPGSGLCVVLDVFGVGQVAAIHDHGGWGAFACLEGREIERRYALRDGVPVEAEVTEMPPGAVAVVAPPGDGFHQVECASPEPSISLHVYGVDIGRAVRKRWNERARTFERFSSGYSNEVAGLPVYRPAIPA